MNKTIYPIIACLSLPSISEAQETPPNILVIITDQHSGPVMTQRGYSHIKTPGIDKLAEQGVTFTRGYCAYPVSMSSRRSMMTGIMPGICSDVTAYPSIGKTLNTAGYETGYFGKWHVGSTDIDEVKDWHGFETYEDGHDDTEITNWSLDFMKQERENPFFMVTSFQNPHDACELARIISGVNDNYHDGAVEEAMDLEFCPPLPGNFAIPLSEAEGFYGRRFQEPGDNYWKAHPTIDWTSTEWRQYIYGYDRLLEKVDAHIEEIVDELDSLGILENTVVIYTSDHGDGHASHQWNQKKTFYEESINIPFVVSWKGQTKAGIIDEETLVNSGLDLYPTILKLAGLAVPESLHGRDLGPGFLQDAGGEPAVSRKYVVSEISQKIYTGNTPGDFTGRMLVTNNLKYILFNKGVNREQLFDLENDPGELEPVTDNPDYLDQLSSCRQMLKEWVLTIGDDFDVDKIISVYESDAKSDAISINDIAISEFDPANLNYSVELEYSDSVVIGAIPVNSGATVTITQASDIWGDTEAKTAEIVVVSEDGSNTNNYQIILDVAEYVDPEFGSTLLEITINGIPIDGFDPDLFIYTLTLDYTNEIIIGATPGASQASVSIIQAVDIWGDTDARTAHILVVSMDGSTSNDYHITVNVTEFLFKTGFIDTGIDIPAEGWKENYGMISENIDPLGNHGEYEGAGAYKFVRGQYDKVGFLNSSYYEKVKTLAFWMFILNPENTAEMKIETETSTEGKNTLGLISSNELSATEWIYFSFDVDNEEATRFIFIPSLPYDGDTRFWMDDLSISTTAYYNNANTSVMDFVNDISVFPNPASEYIIVDVAGESESRLMVYNTTGQIILNRFGIINKEPIDISALEKGIYILRIETKSQVSTFKFIKL